MENKQEKVFAKGIYFENPRQGSPEFIKGRISIKVPEFIPFLQSNQNNAGYVNLDLKMSKEGKLYIELNTWKPSQEKEVVENVKKEEKVVETVDYPEQEIDIDSIPF